MPIYKRSRLPSNSILFKYGYKFLMNVRGGYQKIQNISALGLSQFATVKHAPCPNSGRIAVVAIFKNEATYLAEWIEYHKIIGIDKFFLYDNDSTDDPLKVLQTYIDAGVVVYSKLPGKNRQLTAYMQCINLVKGSFDWLLTIDIDEFLQPVSSQNLKSFLQSVPLNVSQIEIGWMIFGSSGYIDRPDGFVIENFVHHARNNFLSDSKPIVRPERVITMRFPHYYEVGGRTADENMNTLGYYPWWDKPGAQPISRNIFRINHYYSKSKSEFFQKRKRGDAFRYDREERNVHDFEEHDRNEVTDLSMLKIAKTIHSHNR